MTTPPASGATSNQPSLTRDTTRLGAALVERYSIEREIGAGGMATVYLAEDLRHHRKVTIKALAPSWLPCSARKLVIRTAASS